jgi:hypothetical protein
MSFVAGKGESFVREEEAVWYHHGHTKYGSLMFGKLSLTNKRFMFTELEPVRVGGVFSKRYETRTKGIRLNLPVERVIGAQGETRTRKKGTRNDPPTLLSKEQFGVLVVSMETDSGIENPVFEVGHPEEWVEAIQRLTGGEVH